MDSSKLRFIRYACLAQWNLYSILKHLSWQWQASAYCDSEQKCCEIVHKLAKKLTATYSIITLRTPVLADKLVSNGIFFLLKEDDVCIHCRFNWNLCSQTQFTRRLQGWKKGPRNLHYTEHSSEVIKFERLCIFKSSSSIQHLEPVRRITR